MTKKYNPLQHTDILKKIIEFRDEDCHQITNEGKRCKNAFIYSYTDKKGNKIKKDCSSYCLKDTNWLTKKIPTKIRVKIENVKKVKQYDIKSIIIDIGPYFVNTNGKSKRKIITINDNFANIFKKYINILIDQNKKLREEIPKAMKKLENMLKLSKDVMNTSKNGDLEYLIGVEDISDYIKECIEYNVPFVDTEIELPEFKDEPKNYKKLREMYNQYREDYDHIIESNINDNGTYYYLVISIDVGKRIEKGSIILFPELENERFIVNNNDWEIITDYEGTVLEIVIIGDNEGNLSIKHE